MGSPTKSAPVPLERGDTIYAKHPKHGAVVVKVLAYGKDGYTAEDGSGKRHKLLHDTYLGHQSRVVPSLKVVDQGADGMLVEDTRGMRRFVKGEIPKPEPAQPSGNHTAAGETDDPLIGGLNLLKKALQPLMLAPLPPLPEGVVLMIKASGQPLAHRQGLTQRRVTDRSGRTENRWVRTMKDQPKERHKKPEDPASSAKPVKTGAMKDRPVHKHGDTVTFRHGDVEGHGKIVGSGADGVTVRTEDGREHQVRHDALEPPPSYPDKKDGQDDKAYLKEHADKMPSPRHVPEEHERFFNMGATTKVVPIDKIVSSKTDAENEQGGKNAPKFMMAAYHGKVAKRDPVKVEKQPDGTFKVLDGNGTFTGAKAAGWKDLPVEVTNDGAGEVKPLFDEAQTAGLPDAAAQPVKTQDELFGLAPEALAAMQEWLDKGKGVASQLGYQTMTSAPEDADMTQPGGMLFIAPVKSAKRSAEKVELDYGGDWSKLIDPVRASIAVDTYDELSSALEALQASGMKLARKPKDRFAKPTPVGYRDALLNVTLPNGLVGELQLHVKAMLIAKAEGHHHYETERTLGAKKGVALSNTDRAKLQAAIDSQTKIYEAAWQDSIGGSAQGSEGTMGKALDMTDNETGDGGYSYFEHDNAQFRRLNQAPFREVDDVLHGKNWVPYGGDKLKPALFGNEVADPLAGGPKGGKAKGRATKPVAKR
jgi:hypothetical protein